MKVLWFSRHPLTEEQRADLDRIYGPVEVHQVNKTIQAAREVADDIAQCDVIAIVAPLPLQQQFLELAGGKPVVICKNDRLLNPEDGTKIAFVHAGWFQLRRIEVVLDRL